VHRRTGHAALVQAARLRRFGDGAGGLVGRCAAALFEALKRETTTSAGFPTMRSVAVRFVEFFDELLTDLLAADDRGGAVVVVGESAFDGAQLCGATRQRVNSAQQVLQLVSAARLRRDAYAEKADAKASSAAYFEFEISHKIRGKPKAGGPQYRCVSRSRVTLLELPSTHKLREPVEELISREGATRNSSLLAFKAACESLGAGGAAPVERALLSRLMADTLGANALCASLACVGDDKRDDATALQLQQALTAVPHYPVSLRRTHAVGLLSDLRRRAAALKDVAAEARAEAARLRRALGGGAAAGDEALDEGPAAAAKRRSLEGDVAAALQASARAQDDLAKVYKVLDLFKHKYSDLAGDKKEAAKQLIAAEHARLEMSKALIAAKSQASDLAESREVERYRAESELLASEDARADAEGKLDDALREAHKAAADSADVTTLRAERDDRGRELRELDDRNLELSTELISLVSQRDAYHEKLQKVTKDYEANAAIVAAFQHDLDDRDSAQSRASASLKLTEETMETLALKHAQLQVDLERANVQSEATLLDRDKATAELAHRADAELREAKAALDESVREARAASEAGTAEAQKLRGEARAAERRARDADVDLQRVSGDLDRASADGAAAAADVAALEKKYRERLERDLGGAVGAAPLDGESAPAPAADDATRLYAELVKSHADKEERIEAEAAALRDSKHRLQLKFRSAADHGRRLSDVLEDHAPEAATAFWQQQHLKPEEVWDELGAAPDSSSLADEAEALATERAAAEAARFRLRGAERELLEQRASTVATLDALRQRGENEGSRHRGEAEQIAGLERENGHLRDLLADLSSKLAAALERPALSPPKFDDEKRRARDDVSRAAEELARVSKHELSSPRVPVDLGAAPRLALAQQENDRLKRELQALRSGDAAQAADVLNDVESRCAMLSYKNAALEEELRSYREYMKKTVKRFASISKDAARGKEQPR